ncbi:hypothetical protein [Brucella cytisi]|uniref:hypothetical protein n=1 Tax=Brucella cytisi TaxID=407152 RepID=UPI00313EBA25
MIVDLRDINGALKQPQSGSTIGGTAERMSRCGNWQPCLPGRSGPKLFGKAPVISSLSGRHGCIALGKLVIGRAQTNEIPKAQVRLTSTFRLEMQPESSPCMSGEDFCAG